MSVLSILFLPTERGSGLADTALRTSKSGYLTRRLVDVAQMLLFGKKIVERKRILLSDLRDENDHPEPFEERVLGRIALKDVVDENSGEILVQ